MVTRAVVFDIGGVLVLTELISFDGLAVVDLALIESAMADVWEAGGIGSIAEVSTALRIRLGLAEA
jgi:hypothetical protein